jgi:hypothetical protein
MSSYDNGDAHVPELPDEPDPSRNEDWVGTTSDAKPGESIAGIVHDRREITVRDELRVVLDVAEGDGRVTSVPAFRTHLRELVAMHDPQPGDGIAIRYFGPEPGGRKERYGMNVDKSARLAEPVGAVEQADDQLDF